jgi:hypothetical protein
LASPSTLERLPAGRSWMKAAVFWRNMGMSGTCSTAMTAAARSAASWWGSAKVPAVA